MAKESLREHLNRKIKEKGSTLSKEKAKAKKYKSIAAAKKAVSSAGKSHDAMQKGFKFGTVTVVDVLDALRDEFSYRRDYRQAQYDFAVSRLSLLKASGTLKRSDIEQIDGWLSRVD